MSTDQSQTGQSIQSDAIDLAEKVQKAKEEAAKKDQAQKGDDDEITKLKNELQQMTEMAKRTMADLTNLKRRQEEERRIIINMANIDLIRNIIPILGNLERAKQHVPDTAKEWFQGLEISINQLNKVLIDAGLRPMETVGQQFNPEWHEALLQGPGEKDVIIEELEKGYFLGDRVLKHAKVKIGTGNTN